MFATQRTIPGRKVAPRHPAVSHKKVYPPAYTGKAAPRPPAMSHKKIYQLAVTDTGVDRTYYAPQPTWTTEAGSDFTGGLNGLFSMYNEKAERDDRNAAANWKGQADRVLHAAGLFSIMVAISLGRSYQPFSQDASAFYLAQIYRLSTSQNDSFVRFPLASSDPSTVTFTPTVPAPWVHALWSLSLVTSLACILFASMLQQWARRYLHITQGLRNPQQRVRIRELMVQGVEKYHLPWVASALYALFHISIFVFLVGYVMSLSNINYVGFMAIFTCVAACAALYLCFSLSPILCHDSPYYTPLSSLVWSCMVGIPWLTLKFIYRATERLNFISYRVRIRILDLARIFHRRTFMGMMKEVEDLAQTRALELDAPAISRTFDSLEGDQDMVQFLVSIPGFYSSTEVEKDAQVLEHLHSIRFPSAIVSFMDRSWSSDLLPEVGKRARIGICLDALNADPLLLQCTFRQTLLSMRSSIFECIDFVLGVELHNNNSDPWTRHYARCIVAIAINRVQGFNDSWRGIFQRQQDSFNFSLDNLLSNDDSVRLINFIRIARDLSTSYLNSSDQFEPGMIWHNVLSEARKFNAIDTAPELRHQFCALWNDLVDVAQDAQGSSMARANAIRILSLIRTAYLPLHHGTRSAPVAYSASTDDHDPVLLMGTSYTRCTVEYHQPPILDAVGSILPSSGEKTTLPEPEPTPSVSQLPAVDDTNTDPGPLTLAIQKALPDDSRIRILVVGKSGSGKSSLINSIFKTSTPAMLHHEFDHDIETEHCPVDNPQLIFHESPGFPSWDESSLQTIQDFTTERTGAKRPESRRLDAIWLCISIPDTTHGRVEGVEEVLRMGKVPVVVVFTKFDWITDTPDYRPAASDADNAQLSQLAHDAAHEQCRILCRSLFDKDPGELPAVNVSVLPGHDNLIKKLIKMTDKSITDSIMAPMPLEWSIEQKGSRDLKIDASIELGGETYWRSLWSSIDLKGQQLHDCLITLHAHIVNLWNLSDRNQYLSSDEFKAKMSHLVADLANQLVTSSGSVPTTSLKVAPSSSGGLTAPRTQDLTALMSSVHQSIIIPCVIGYMIDLTVILYELSKSIGNVSPRDVQFAVTEHVISGRQKQIHRVIRSFILETSTVKIIQEDLVIEMIIDLTKEFLVSPDS